MSFQGHQDKYLVWVLAPFLETEDPTLQYYYDYTQSIAEYTKVFAEVGCEWKWTTVTLNSIDKVISEIKEYPTSKSKLVINLCDGDEVNGVPGVSVIHALEEHQLMYTGSNDFFYTITTSKIPMKEAFDQAGVPTARWRVIDPKKPVVSDLLAQGKPFIVKPAVSAGSMGLGVKNVVSNEAEFSLILNEMTSGFHGWKLDTGGVFMEEFITGREFTTLVVGSSTHPESIYVYAPAERVFHSSLPENEKFLSFDRLWETYDREAPMNGNGYLYEYREVDAALLPTLTKISLDAFMAVGGMGYGRLDIRMDTKTGTFYVLEINAQCGLSEDEDYTSIGAILRFDKKSFTYLIIQILEDACMRHKVTTR